MTHPRSLLALALLALACASCSSVEAAPLPDPGPLLHVDFTRSAAELAALGDVAEVFVVTPEVPAHYQIIDSHITVPQRLHFEGSLASRSTVTVECLSDGGDVIGAYVVDDVHGEEGQRGAPASRRPHGEVWPNPLPLAFHVQSLDEAGEPGAPFSALAIGGPYQATGFTARITLRRAGTILQVP